MEIIVGKNAGFCYGVKRAVESTKSDLKKDKEICCLGEIVHNKEVIKELSKKGVKFIKNIEEANSTVIIRAHGETKEVYEYAKENNITLRDYTCPNVLKIHEIAQKYSNEGFFIILLGSDKHPENIGTSSYCGKNYIIIEDEKKLFKTIDKIEKFKFKKVLVISQTTFSLENFYMFTEILKNELDKSIELVVENTICNATEIRQKEVADLSRIVDFMIIIGGKNSSNTKKLYDIACANCKQAICIENKNELENKILNSYNKIGIMAGASTPQNSIEEVVEFLKNHLQNSDNML